MQTYSIQFLGELPYRDVNASSIDNLRRNLIRDYGKKADMCIAVYHRYKKGKTIQRTFIGMLSTLEVKSKNPFSKEWVDKKPTAYIWNEHGSLAREVNPSDGKLRRW